MKKFVTSLGLVAAFSMSTLSANAGVLLLDNYDNTSFSESRSAGDGILAQILVGNKDVTIEQFGVLGRQTTAGNIRFSIFDSNKTRVYNSGPIAASAGNVDQWYDSGFFNLTLKANSAYYFGLLSDQAFVYAWETDGIADVGKGLTSPASGQLGSNGNFINFADPQVEDYCCVVQQSTRIYGTDPTASVVPEPGSLSLLGLGALALMRRRNRK